MNGLYQIIGETLKPIRERLIQIFHLNKYSLSHKILNCAVTFVLITFSWIFFRAGEWFKATEVIKSMVKVHNPWILFDGSLYTCGLDDKNFRIMILSIMVLLFADVCKYKGIKIREILAKQDYWCRWFVIVVAINIILIYGVWGTAYDANTFIYFQF